MNYFPYYSGLQYASNAASSTGLFGGIFKGLSLGKIIGGTQKTLNFVNQTLPLIKQTKPMIDNAKTMFKVMNEFKKFDTPTNTNKPIINQDIIKTNNNNQAKYDVKYEEIKQNINKSNTQSTNTITFFQ